MYILIIYKRCILYKYVFDKFCVFLNIICFDMFVCIDIIIIGLVLFSFIVKYEIKK